MKKKGLRNSKLARAPQTDIEFNLCTFSYSTLQVTLHFLTLHEIVFFLFPIQTAKKCQTFPCQTAKL
jgi:hypothetical protein